MQFYKAAVGINISVYLLKPIMAIDLVAAVQKRLGLPELQRITFKEEGLPGKEKPPGISQVALVCVTAALYKLTRTNEGCVKLLLSGKNDNWLELEEAYGKTLPFVIEEINEYGVADSVATAKLLHDIANGCLLVMHEELFNHINTEMVHDFMSDQRHNILIYKPANLPLGKILRDNVMDDDTNKMEGPVSNWMHKIENLFS
jgi:hypothetical protein